MDQDSSPISHAEKSYSLGFQLDGLFACLFSMRHHKGFAFRNLEKAKDCKVYIRGSMFSLSQLGLGVSKVKEDLGNAMHHGNNQG